MKKIPLTKGKFALVDDEDYEYLSQWKWHVGKGSKGKEYAMRDNQGGRENHFKILMHREILGCIGKEQGDHRDSNGLNNQRSNLRKCSNMENSWNKKKMKGSSMYKGVYWHKLAKKWGARITKNYKQHHIGLFISEKKAAMAYDEKARELFGEFALTNFNYAS